MLEVINNSTKDTFYSNNSEFLNLNGNYEKIIVHNENIYFTQNFNNII